MRWWSVAKAMSASASAREAAIGFSTRTSMPAWSRALPAAACALVGTQTDAAWISISPVARAARQASRLAKMRTFGKPDCSSFVRAGSLSTMAVSRTASPEPALNSRMTRRWLLPKAPAPMTAKPMDWGAAGATWLAAALAFDGLEAARVQLEQVGDL